MKPRVMLGRRRLMSVAAGALGAGVGRRAVAAADAVRLICGFGAGNPTDLCAQLIQDSWAAALDEPVLFDYAIGEAGLVAAREVVAAVENVNGLCRALALNNVIAFVEQRIGLDESR